jgi:DNA polymerase III sliding clamp (beta) subunit (PCNA family)
MKARINVDQFATALAAAKPAVGSNRPFVLLTPTEKGTEIGADDLDLGVRVTIDSWSPLDAKENEGPVMVPFAPLAALLAATDAEDVELAEVEGGLEIRAGGTDMVLPTVDADWFPRREPAQGTAIELSAEDWSFVQTLIPFCSTEEGKGAANGLWFGPWGVAATDTYHLGCWKHSFDQPAIVPGAVLAALRTQGAVTITLGPKSVTVTTEDNMAVTTSTIQGEPVDYHRAMKPVVASITVNRSAFKEAMRRVGISARPSFRGSGRQVRVDPEDRSSIRLTSLPGEKTHGSVTEVFHCDITGELEPFAIDTAMVANCMDLVGTDEVELGWGGPGNLFMVQSDMVDAFVMPVKLI